SQNNKTGEYRDARSARSVHLQFLQGHQHEKECEHEISPGGKQNILPAHDANELLPQPVPPACECSPCCQREMAGMLPHVVELPQRIEMFWRMIVFQLEPPSRYLG